MAFDPRCLINVFLAFFALCLYIIGSYRFYKNIKGFRLILGIALLTDVVTALLASFKITFTTQIPGTVSVPWHSFLFKIHVAFSTAGIIGFLLLFLYLLVVKPSRYNNAIRKWQFLVLLPIWVAGELIALTNALSKICFSVRLFESI